MRKGQRRGRDEGSARFTRQCRPDPCKIHPYRILDLGRVKRKRRIICLPGASNHQRGWKGPRLAHTIAHAVDANTRFLPQLPGHRFLRSEEHTSELQSLMRNSYAVFCLKKKKYTTQSYKPTKTTLSTTP